MNNADVRRRADAYMQEKLSEFMAQPFGTINNWPEYPQSSMIDLGVPADLLDEKCRFTLMKDTRPDGAIRVAVQYSHYRFLGMSDLGADGFVITADGTISELSEQDRWDLT